MKRFVNYCIVFIFIFFGTLIFLDSGISFIEREFGNFKIVSQPKYIIVGHSHPECAFNDSLISNFKNLSHSGESYFYTFFKVKQILSQNPTIETVFIEYTNNQINKNKDQWIWDSKFMTYRYPLYSSFMNTSDKFLLFKNNPIEFINSYSISIRTKLICILQNNFDFINKIGGYNYLVNNRTDSLINNLQRESGHRTPNRCISHANLAYLSAIVELCHNSKKNVVFLRSPLHEKYPGYINETVYKEILDTRYSEIEFVDFSNFPLSNAEFADLEHLNYKGASKFSRWFNSLLNEGFTNMIDKQLMIEKKIDSLSRFSVRN